MNESAVKEVPQARRLVVIAVTKEKSEQRGQSVEIVDSDHPVIPAPPQRITRLMYGLHNGPRCDT